MSESNHGSSGHVLAKEARRWVRDLPNGSLEDRQRFMDWVGQSGEHLAAYLQAQARADKVAALKRGSLAMGIVLLGCGLLTWPWLPSSTASATYQTSIGEHRTIELADHTEVHLDSRSTIRTVFSNTKRTVELIDGQALFTVAGDSRRPFVVSCGDAQIAVIGTQFNVDKNRTSAVVSVVEGRVRVATSSDQPTRGPQKGSLELVAGQQLTLTPQAAHQPVSVDVKSIVLWTQGKGTLTFNSAPLSTVIDEFNRYNARQIRMSPSVADRAISVTFTSTDPRGLIEYLGRRPGLRIAEDQREIDILPAETHQ